MGKLGSPRSPPPSSFSYESSGTKISQSRFSDGLTKSDITHLGSFKGGSSGNRYNSLRKHAKFIAVVLVFVGSLVMLDTMMLSVVHHFTIQKGSFVGKSSGLQVLRSDSGGEYVFHEFESFLSTNGIIHQKTCPEIPQQNGVAVRNNRHSMENDEVIGSINEENKSRVMYERLLRLASHSLGENGFRQDSLKVWKEPHKQAALWKPCADQHNLVRQGSTANNTGYILVSANGGLNQQRVAVCNAVAIAALLNATLVLPKFLYSSVWKDVSQFGDIYQEEHFLKILKEDLNIVKELPSHLQSLDIEAIGSLITDADIMKESRPVHFVKAVLPLLLQNGVVHFLGFGNRLAFDPLPYNLQRLRCKCNFHALKFVPKIQEAGSLLVQRIRKYNARWGPLDEQLLGKYMPIFPLKEYNTSRGPSRYLALHLRFEVDMVAYSQCEFGGGEHEKKELQAYREIHFPALVMRTASAEFASPTDLRKLGRCPLTPEEAALVLAALGFKHGTYIYLAGSHIYGGQSRMAPFTSLYPNLVTKENLLTSSELAPFRNFSSQLAALDFIACAVADVFSMTDSGSQLSSLVSGYRTYYGGGRAPTLRPNKKRLAQILSGNGIIKWSEFQQRVKKMIEEGQRVRVRPAGRSIYRQPRSPECMCRA